MSRSLKSLALRTLLWTIHGAGHLMRALFQTLARSLGWTTPMAKRILVRIFIVANAVAKVASTVLRHASALSSVWNPKRMMLQTTVVLVALIGTRQTLFASDQVAPVAKPNIVAQLINPQPPTTLIEDTTLPILQPASSANPEDLSAIDPQLLDLFVYDEETNNRPVDYAVPEATDEAYVGIESPLTLPGSDSIPLPKGPARASIIEYMVAEGDTVSSIAEQFNISINTVLWENSLGAYSIIRPGQILRILPTSGIKYVVKKGDTLSRIANATKSAADEIASFNSITDSQLVAGTTIIIPRGRAPAVPRAAARVKPAGGETMFSIPKGVDVSNIVGLVWPTINRKINQYFRGSRHTGVDIKGSTGTPIYAADNGAVVLAGWNRGGYGLQVVVKHDNGTLTRYAHSSKLLVKSGEIVDKGQVIALIGNTGRSTGPHLHFEVLKGNQRLNPLLFYK